MRHVWMIRGRVKKPCVINKSHTAVAELTGHIFIPALHMKICSIMVCRAPAFLLKSERICLGERSDNLKQLLSYYCIIKNCNTVNLLSCIFPSALSNVHKSFCVENRQNVNFFLCLSCNDLSFEHSWLKYQHFVMGYLSGAACCVLMYS